MLLFFESRNFEIKNALNKKYFCVKDIKGLCLVYFYTSECGHCKKFTNFFTSAPNRIKGEITFVMCNAQNMLPFLSATNDSTTPINEVPYILLYHDGWPIRRYDGQQDYDVMANFIRSALDDISRTKNASNSGQPQAALSAQAPQPPKNQNQVCYLTFGEAYNTKATMLNRTEDKV